MGEKVSSLFLSSENVDLGVIEWLWLRMILRSTLCSRCKGKPLLLSSVVEVMTEVAHQRLPENF